MRRPSICLRRTFNWTLKTGRMTKGGRLPPISAALFNHERKGSTVKMEWFAYSSKDKPLPEDWKQDRILIAKTKRVIQLDEELTIPYGRGYFFTQRQTEMPLEQNVPVEWCMCNGGDCPLTRSIRLYD